MIGFEPIDVGAIPTLGTNASIAHLVERRTCNALSGVRVFVDAPFASVG
jgi:hypothetical protein